MQELPTSIRSVSPYHVQVATTLVGTVRVNEVRENLSVLLEGLTPVRNPVHQT